MKQAIDSQVITSADYIEKRCVLCQEGEEVIELYPQTFKDGDLDARVFSARRHTEHYHYQIVRCLNCGMIFSRNILSDDKLLALYGESEVTFSEFEGVLRSDYWRPIAPFLNEQCRGSALEIGCSSGFFLDELKQRGFCEVFGCEPSVQAKNKAPLSVRDSIHVGFFEGPETFPGRLFNLACSFHTFDHVSDPVSILRSVHDVLAPKGLLYLITHDTEALQAKLLGEKSPIIDVEHIYLFNRKNLSQLVERNGYRVVGDGRLINSYPLRYWCGMLPAQGLIRSLLNTVADSFLGRIAVPLPAGNLYLIAEKT